MTDIDVLLEKTNSIQNCLNRIQQNYQPDSDSLENLNTQDVVTLNLQRAIQLVLDMASHIVASERLGIPQTLRDLFVILEKNQIIEPTMSYKLQKMVGFRNIAVHDYQAINPAILKSILNEHLQDIVDFYTVVIKRLGKL